MVGEPEDSRSEGPFSERFEEALSFAATTHRRQVRKGSGVPYIGHLLGVSSLVIEDGGSENEAIAALLHDASRTKAEHRCLPRSVRGLATRWR